MLHSIVQDLRYALRMMRKTPGVTFTALAALALGIGATSAIFSLVYGVMLRPLPYEEPGRIVLVERVAPFGHQSNVSARRYTFWHDHQHSLESIAAEMGGRHVNLEGGDQPDRVMVRDVTADFFRVLRVQPAIGRTFLPGEDGPAAAPVAVLGYGLWKRAFGGNPGAIGHSIILGSKSYTVVGVAPPGIDSTLAADVFTPVDPSTSPLANGSNFQVFGRLSDGVTLAQANANMRVVADQYRAAYPNGVAPGETAGAYSYQAEIGSDIRPMLLILLAAVGLVLLIACANVANLLLARAAVRRREVAVRVALGASAGRVLRQLLTESLALSLISSALGLGLANVAVWAVVTFKPVDLPRLEEVTVDWRVALFAAALAVLTGILFGIAPALQVLRTDPRDALAEGGARGGQGRGHRRLRDALVVVEYCVSVFLLVGALLLTRSFVRLLGVDPGFNPANAITAQVSLTGARYQTPAQVALFDQQLVERVRRDSGVEAAATTNYLPLSGGFNIPLGSIENQPNLKGDFLGNLEWFGITPDFFRAMGMPLKDGRMFDERDTAAAPPVVIVNQSFVKKFFPKQIPLGQRITIAWDLIGKTAADPPREIVGVVADIHETSLDQPASWQTFVPISQVNPPVSTLVNSIMPTTLVVRSAAGANISQGRNLTEEVRAVDPLLPVFQVRTLEDVVGESLGQRKFMLWLIGSFAVAAVLLAAIGIYGVMAYLVTQRTRELGIRAALGARPADLLRMVIGEAALRATVGLVVGLAGAFAVTKLLTAFLYGVKPRDTVAFLAAPAILLLVALLATWLPARRAARVEPMIALRHE
ncbi:MAG TPA: ABC transporter permease [Candidatus Acidoferrales bacterium]|nr:ABC transporter permease [Candidatus Acidoferrales bacterium]